MLGNLRYAWLACAIVAAVAATACATNVPQHSSSGKDYRPKGAKKIELTGTEGRAKDIVTYPGGDRVDWKLVELPEGKKGELRFRVKYKPARPGLDVAFEVYDEYFERVGRAKPGGKRGKKSSSSSKSVKIKGAQGKYYVQVYAPERGDAAKYTLSVRFKELKPLPVMAAADLASEIGEPPSLPSVPKPAAEVPGAIPPGGPAVTPPPQDTPPPGAAAKPVKARIVTIQNASGGGVIVILSKGTQQGVQRGWSGQLLQGSSDTPVSGGDFKIIQVNASQSVGKIKSLGVDQVKANRTVLLTP